MDFLVSPPRETWPNLIQHVQLCLAWPQHAHVLAAWRGSAGTGTPAASRIGTNLNDDFVVSTAACNRGAASKQNRSPKCWPARRSADRRQGERAPAGDWCLDSSIAIDTETKLCKVKYHSHMRELVYGRHLGTRAFHNCVASAERVANLPSSGRADVRERCGD